MNKVKEKTSYFEVLLSDKTNHINLEEINGFHANEDILLHQTQILLKNKFLIRIVKTLIFMIMVAMVSLGRTYGLVNFV